MQFSKLSDLIRYIISEVDDKGGYINTIRLVKFLYLIDIEYFRIRQELLSNVNWIYYKFGPYSSEISSAGNSLGYNLSKEEFTTKKGYRGTLFHSQGQNPPNWLDHTSFSVINRILEIWCDQETSILLSYVYHETEPMINGEYGQPLNFSLIEPGSRFYHLDFKEIKEKERINFLNSLRTISEDEEKDFIEKPKFRDDLYFEFKNEVKSEENNSYS